MHLIVLCIGILSCAYLGECQLVWTTPPDNIDNGIVGAINQEDSTTADIYGFALDAVTAIAITSQEPTGVFVTTVTVASNVGPLRLASTKKIDYTAATSHVIVLEATNSGTTETATMTLVVRPIAHTMPIQCVDINGYYAAATALATAAATGASTITQAQVGTTTGYTFTAAGGAIKNDAIITTATTAAQVTVVSTASEAFGTATTATSTVHLCINSGCTCSSVLSGSSASAITAGLLSIIMGIMLKLK